MNYSLLAAGVLSGITLIAHLFGGGPEILAPMVAGNLPPDHIAVWTVVWHGISATLAIGTVALLSESIKPGYLRGLAWGVCVQYISFAGLFIFYGFRNLGSLWPMPQWIAFLLIVFLAVVGLRRAKVQQT